MNLDDGPMDPFLGDPDDPAALLEEAEPAQPLSEDERADVLADLADFAGPLDAEQAPDAEPAAEPAAEPGSAGGAAANSEPAADTGAAPGAARPAGGARRPTVGPAVQVVVALSTLLGCDQYPAELVGHGPIPAALAREIAADPTGTWHRLVTDGGGRLLDASRSYTPPPRLRAHVIARDLTCRFPGCRRQATGCEIDHVVAYSAGGPTAEPNLHALCPRHHHLKHEAGWKVQRRDGTTEWTTPTGRRIDKPPDDPLAA